MYRRTLLKNLLASSVVPLLDRLQAKPMIQQSKPQSTPQPASVLRIILDGAFTVVLRSDSRWKVEVFSPADPLHRHEFRFFGSKVNKTCKNEIASASTWNFTLPLEGIKTNPVRPSVDACLRDFNVATDRWCRDRYFVTLDLPAPRRITSIPPLSSVVFQNPDPKGRARRGCLTSNYVLEYDIVDDGKIKMAWQQGGENDQEFTPITWQELLDRYAEGCKELKAQSHDQTMEMPKQCSENGSMIMHQKLKAWKPADLTYFFGVGLPPAASDRDHPVSFFNDQILASFPDLQKRLAIQSFGGYCQKCTADEYSEDVLLKHEQSQARLVEISSVIDCHFAGPVVTQPTSTS